MQFCFKRAIVIAATTVLGACSSSDDQQVINEDHQYVNTQEQGPLVLPQGATPVKVGDEFVLPEHQSKGLVGESLDLQSPPQLLALASGSRLDKKGVKNKIWFDRTTVVEDLPEFAFDALKGYLRQERADGSQLNDGSKTSDTGWITDTIEGSFWPWADGDKSTSLRFDTKQAHTENGAVATVQAQLTGMRINGEDIPLSSMTDKDKLRAEVQFMNGYIYYFQLAQEKLLKKKEVAKVYEMSLRVSNDAQGQSVFRSDKNADLVWVHFRTLLEEVGFEVEDVDRSARKLFVRLGEKETSFWQSLWSSNDSDYDIDMPYGSYMVRVTTSSTKSVVTFYDEFDKPIADEHYQAVIGSFTAAAKKLALEL